MSLHQEVKRTKTGKILGRQHNDDYGAAHLPTPEEIAEATKFIRDGWDGVEERARRVGPSRVPVEIQMTSSEGYLNSRKTNSYDY